MARTIKNLSGQRFGKLIAVKPSEERKNGQVMWECRCDCGNTVFVLTSSLTNGSTKSCGCLRKLVGERRFKDISGQRFGKLVVLRPNEERNNKQLLWDCQCDCGNTTVARGFQLKNGTVKSCGCLLRERVKRDPTRDLTGQRVGKLVVVGPTDMRKYHQVVWECKCDCGNTAFVPTASLTSGNTSSCGCNAIKLKDLTGKRFGMLVALRPAAERKQGYAMWECRCDCGTTVFVRGSNLTSGNSKSCGCTRNQKAKG